MKELVATFQHVNVNLVECIFHLFNIKLFLTFFEHNQGYQPQQLPDCAQCGNQIREIVEECDGGNVCQHNLFCITYPLTYCV
jgi:hypothetical protein